MHGLEVLCTPVLDLFHHVGGAVDLPIKKDAGQAIGKSGNLGRTWEHWHESAREKKKEKRVASKSKQKGEARNTVNHHMAYEYCTRWRQM
jgi:hypothetical protein